MQEGRFERKNGEFVRFSGMDGWTLERMTQGPGLCNPTLLHPPLPLSDALPAPRCTAADIDFCAALL